MEIDENSFESTVRRNFAKIDNLGLDLESPAFMVSGFGIWGFFGFGVKTRSLGTRAI